MISDSGSILTSSGCPTGQLGNWAVRWGSEINNETRGESMSRDECRGGGLIQPSRLVGEHAGRNPQGCDGLAVPQNTTSQDPHPAAAPSPRWSLPTIGQPTTPDTVFS